MIRRVLIALAFFFTLSQSVALTKTPGTIATVDLMRAFFTADAASLPLDKRIELFKEKILYPNRSLYDGQGPFDDVHIAWYLNELTPKTPQLRRFTTAVATALPAYEAKFESAFPKFDPATVTIYLMPSMGHFDGMTKDVGGNHGLLIGVDNLSQENLSIGIFLDHEMFHIYHHDINRAFFPTSSENDLYQYGLYRQVWAEGLATYVSQQLNPGASTADVLASADLANLSQSDAKKLACIVSAHFGSNDVNYAGLLFDESQHPAALPPRGGYYVGYVLAKDLGRSRTLSELADMRGDELYNTLHAIVSSLCGEKPT
ncbi:MAG: hypothetical protein JO165_09995 [Candidatus Eremiobacteraeota bacterium]|nr:hypothetical protein [Candidatus Eremiobacteraeota bacterium]